ncbi:MAG: hypothetical protein HQ595_00170, partial [Candidatus Omnitrophica bacterium]|nr:hypothetical protein [Candidatus Omnitrophota bacterium]
MQVLRILLPKNTNSTWHQLVKQLSLTKPMKPFDNLSLAFVQKVSKVINANKAAIGPELRQLARWTSKAHLKKIYQDYERKRLNRIFLPRGVVLHFTPANVDSLFIYSWFVSLLMGNSNIIRLSQNENPQIKLIIDLLNPILKQKYFRPIRERNLILSYGHQQEITKELSHCCNVRVIWGGDETVRRIRTIPLPPRATELVFADRFSLAAVKASTVLAAAKPEISRLVKNIYYDTLYFTQKACFSPKLLFWIGPRRKIKSAKERFWPAMEKLAALKKIDWPEGIGIARMATG